MGASGSHICASCGLRVKLSQVYTSSNSLEYCRTCFYELRRRQEKGEMKPKYYNNQSSKKNK